MKKRLVVIGAGVGGLTTAAMLARKGMDVTVLEAHVYPGGCAGTFYHQGYQFEAGATLAGGFYPGGPMDLVAQAAGIQDWGDHKDELAMQVHLPDGMVVNRWADERSLQDYRTVFGTQVDKFWRWQQSTADALWDLALRQPAWPPQSLRQTLQLAQKGAGWLAGRFSPGLALDAFRPLGVHLRGLPEAFKLFIDAQLLISAQAESDQANALYGASALDLPRRGVVHLPGGIGSISRTLAQAVTAHGGKVLYRQEVKKILSEKGRISAVETKRGEVFPAELVVANMPPWNIARLLPGSDHLSVQSRRLRSLSNLPVSGWGAFTAYVGFDANLVPAGFPIHHQVLLRRPLGEGNSAFLSINPEWDSERAPAGQRVMTISTHTDLTTWWKLFSVDRSVYEARKEEYLERLLLAAERVIPGIRAGARLLLPGTPVTFQRFTRRAYGWVGGFPQTNLFQAWAPRLASGLWMVGDSIFPGQSTAAVALGGLRVGQDILEDSPLSR